MSLKSFDENVSIHQTLGDNPNSDNGYSAAELKALFDRPAELIKAFLNEFVVPAINKKVDTLDVPVSIDRTLTMPGYAADAAVVGTAFDDKLGKQDVPEWARAESKPSYTAEDVGAAEEVHQHSADDINSGTLASQRLPVVPMIKGGTGGEDGAAGLKNLLAAGPTVLSSHQYGPELPSTGEVGQLFFLKV